MNLKVPNRSVQFLLFKMLPNRVHSRVRPKNLSKFYSDIFMDLLSASENYYLTLYQIVQDSALSCSMVYQMDIFLVGFRNSNAEEHFSY